MRKEKESLTEGGWGCQLRTGGGSLSSRPGLILGVRIKGDKPQSVPGTHQGLRRHQLLFGAITQGEGGGMREGGGSGEG